MFSLIQTDNGGYLVGGKTEAGQNMFEVSKVDPRGEVEWRNSYASQGRVGPCCYAVIELKEGDFIACGQGLEGMAMAVRLNQNGDVVWQRYYPGTTLYGVRETADGLAFVVHGTNGQNNTLMLTTYGGAIVTSKGIGPGKPYSLIRGPEGGFVISGDGLRIGGFGGFGLELNSRLNRNWRTMIDLGSNIGPIDQAAYCISSNYDGYLMVGEMLHAQWGKLATEIFLDHSGNPIWARAAGPHLDGQQKNTLRSVITAPDGSFIACGGSASACISLCYTPVSHTPYFVELNPPDSLVSLLVGDTLTFSARAEDPDGDDVGYTWRLEEEIVSHESSATLTFENMGRFRLVCIASDGEFSDSTFWLVRTTDIYVREHSPDTLDFEVRRGTQIDFSISGRGRLQVPYNYRWLMVDQWNIIPVLVSEDSTLTYTFDNIGQTYLEASVSQGDFRDHIIWSVLVRSALSRWFPMRRNLDVTLDTTVVFGVVPADSITLNWEIRWIFDDERIGGRREEPVTFSDLGLHEMMVRIVQNGMIDTVKWSILVHPPVSVTDPSLMPGQFSYSLSPNPFNEVSQIRVNLPEAEEVTVSLYDSFGRYVRQIDKRAMRSGSHKIAFNAGGLSAGLYFVRLDAGSHHATMKAVLMR